MTTPVSLSNVADAFLNLLELTDAKKFGAGGSLVESLLSSFATGVNGPGSAGATSVTTAPATPPRFDASDLYGASGRPREADIKQDNLSDCGVVSTLGAVGERTPDRIKNAISYDASTGTFEVKLYKNEWDWDTMGYKQVTIKVTQQDILDNLTRGGGSTVDNNPGTDRPIWPAVMETALAKMKDSNWSDGLAEGYGAIQWTWPKETMRAVTGTQGDVLEPMQMFDTKTQAELLYMQVSGAMNDKRPVTLTTQTETPDFWADVVGKPTQDGLVDRHVYMVDRIYKNSSGEVMVELRNPWGNNMVGEGNDTMNATVTVKLETLLETGGFDQFNVGPR